MSTRLLARSSVLSIVFIATIAFAAGVLVATSFTNKAHAQLGQTEASRQDRHAQDQSSPSARQSIAPIPGISRQPSPSARVALIDPDDAVVLLLDHQTGLFQTVKDIPIAELRNNTIVLTKIAELGSVPIIATTSEPNGTNGPLMTELQQLIDAGRVQYVPRKGEISAWDNADFVDAVKATGRSTLIIAGVWTSVCVNFPALQAHADGYNVYIVPDASGDPSEMASRITVDRATQAGIIPATTNVVLSEFQRTWNRSDAAQWGALYAELVPNYHAVAESYERAQEVAR